jgi:hypothetical protein
LTVHWAKFSLAIHAWDEPIIRVSKAAKERNMPLLHPLIGEVVKLNQNTNASVAWWNNLT